MSIGYFVAGSIFAGLCIGLITLILKVRKGLKREQAEKALDDAIGRRDWADIDIAWKRLRDEKGK
jgi:hypothetical protein